MRKYLWKKSFRALTMKMPIFVRKLMTKEKIRRLSEYLMTEKDLLICESDIAQRDIIVKKYMDRYSKSTMKLNKKLEELIRHNSILKSRQDLELIKRDIEFCWFGYGFHPDEYMFFDLGGVNKEPDKRRAFVSEQERVCFRFSVNDFSDSLLSDKADTYNRFAGYYKRNAFCVDRKADLAGFKNFLEGKTEFVQKYVSSSRGQDVKLIKVSEIHLERYFEKLKKQGRFLLEDKIIQSSTLNTHSTSVNNIRVSTFRTRKGIVPVCGFYTMGLKNTFVVNATIGCVFAAIDVKTGLICSDGCDEFGNRYEKHPDSGEHIKGFQLPEWDKAIALCTEIAEQLEHFGYVSFDLAHTIDGWDIVEINPSGQFLHQAGTLAGFRQELVNIMDNMDQLVPYSLVRRKG